MVTKKSAPVKAKELVRTVPYEIRLGELIKGISIEELAKLITERNIRLAQEKPKRLPLNNQKLQKIGLHAVYKHYRFRDGSATTECQVENDKNEIVALGYAICSPRDNFCRADGRVKSLGRAVAALDGKHNQFPLKHCGNNKNEAMENFLLGSEYLGQYIQPELDMY
jgi:hypothetical protein